MTTISRQASALRAAELYYLENQTMDAISQILGCSRATVARESPKSCLGGQFQRSLDNAIMPLGTPRRIGLPLVRGGEG